MGYWAIYRRLLKLRFIGFALTPTLSRRAKELNIGIVPQHLILYYL